jgi:chromosome partitioning protein
VTVLGVHVVAVLNRKGGVGKTASAVNLAAALAGAGQRTLLVDLDPQASASRALAVHAGAALGSTELLRKKGDAQVRYPLPALHRLGVLPADAALAAAQDTVRADPGRGERLRERLGRMRGGSSLAVIDTPPELGGLAGAALRAADAVVVPAAADYLALEALRDVVAAIRGEERRRGSRFAPLLILPTMVEYRRAGSRRALAALHEAFGEQLVAQAAVPRSARFDAAALAGVPVVVSHPESAPAQAYQAAARAILTGIGRRSPGRGGRLKAYAREDARQRLVDPA